MRYLFIGPSLPDVRDHLDGTVRVLPPIAAGDLFRVPLSAGDIVGIVDGYFHHTAAVRHKEIFAALADGVRVLGASSMGALRAAEMHRYGMGGVGYVFAGYRSGRLVGDDEVALLHGPAEAGYPAFSQPLVNIRATIATAVRDGIIEQTHADKLIDAMATMPYVRRNHRTLVETIEALDLPPGQARRIERYCRTNVVDVKRSDALRLLDQLTQGDPRGRTGRPVLHRTSFTANLELASRAESPDGALPTLSAVSLVNICQLFAHDYPTIHRDLVFRVIGQECADGCPDHRPGLTPEQTVVAHGRHRGHYSDRPDGADFTFLTRWTTRSERATRSTEELIAIFVPRAFRVKPGIAPKAEAIALLRDTKAWTRAAKIARVASLVESRLRIANRDSSTLPPARVAAWFAKHWRVDPDDVEIAALDRGFESMNAFLGVAKSYYLLTRIRPELVDFSVRNERRQPCASS
ncbi:TfuA-like protein [Plantactinospora sp. GCM10030261]|uniref:TfuA-like protein n=1 Tax=Plantactinospora sp. GCM10030261 TaxID=3273420 RepID=UPI003614DB7A